MKKKIFSIVCVLALAFSTLSSMIVVEAANTPSYKFSVDFSELEGVELSDENYDSDWYWEDYFGAKVYKASVTIEGPTKKTKVNGNFVGSLVDAIQGRYTYTTDKNVAIVASNHDQGSYTDCLAGAIANTSTVGEFSTSGELSFSWAATTAIKETKIVATWYFIAEDMGTIENIKIAALEADAFKTVAPTPSDTGYYWYVNTSEFYNGTSSVSSECQKDVKSFYATDISVVGYPATQNVSYTAVSTLDDAAKAAIEAKFGTGKYYYTGDAIEFTTDADNTPLYLKATDGETTKATNASIQAHLNLGANVTGNVVPVLILSDSEGPAFDFVVE